MEIDLFEKTGADTIQRPLAFLVRPQTQEDFLGQGQIAKLFERSLVKSFLIWGPPGCGKTTFARLWVSKFKDLEVHELFATETGVPEIKKIIQDAKRRGVRVVIVVDEFHRFTKLQQDVFLKSVEEGDVALVALTTENPKYFVNRALLSRMDVFELKRLSDTDVSKILSKAWSRHPTAKPFQNRETDQKILSEIVKVSEGDARYAIGILDEILSHHENRLSEDSEAVIQYLKSHGIFDSKKSLDEETHYRWISDYIKAMRRGDEKESIQKLKGMLDHGEDPLFISRRQIIFASEDVGLASPALQGYVQAIYDGVKTVGMPEAAILLSSGTLACCRAKKSREAVTVLT
jgi:putative ATPase